MCATDHFIPHRETQPIRHCADCHTLLASANATSTCWQCEPSWSPDPDFTFLHHAIRDSIGDAIDRMLVST